MPKHSKGWLTAYASVLSTRDIKDTLIEVIRDAILSKSAVSNYSGALHKDFEEFQSRDLSYFDIG
ncbi:transposase [Acetomicrobium mobile]|uniref:transposase n=1 Tax=Acetomicrobium mobile TaxID=97477 RepID=UPI00350E369F